MKQKNRGSVLLLSLILCAIMALSLAAYVSTSRTGMLTEASKAKKKTLQSEAEGGVNIAKADLLALGRNQNFSTQPYAEEQGLFFSGKSITMARFAEEAGCKICRNVWYYPSDQNSASDVEFPKAFTVVAIAENRSTGQVYTVESMVILRKENFGELAFAVFDPAPNPRGGNFFYRPHTGAELNGRAHFGSFVPLLINGDYVFQKHEFLGPVTFALTPGPGKTHPFDLQAHAWTQATFKKGYQDGVNIGDMDSATYRDELFDGIRAQETAGIFTASPDDLCLKFVDNVIQRYPCETSETVSPLLRYQGEQAGIAPMETYTIPTAGVILYWPQSVHVKGILDGKLTIITEQNIIPDGDVQYKNQADNSDDRFGAVARNNIFVHHSVPLGNGASHKSDRMAGNYDPGFWNAFENNVNFIVSNDRDSLDKDIKGGNQLSRLDLDGVYFALNGSFMVDGISDWANSPEGLTIRDTVGNIYSVPTNNTIVLPNPNYFYLDADLNGVPDGRKGNPMYCLNCCFSWSPNCPAFNPAALGESPKALGQNLKLYGGLLTKNYSETSISLFYSGLGFQHVGFYGFEISTQPTLALSPPPGFPNTENLVINTLYQKAYNSRFVPSS